MSDGTTPYTRAQTTKGATSPMVSPSDNGGGLTWEAWLAIGLSSAIGLFNILVCGFAILHRYLRDHHTGRYPKLQKYSGIAHEWSQKILRWLKMVKGCSNGIEPSEYDYEMGRPSGTERLIGGYDTTKFE